MTAFPKKSMPELNRMSVEELKMAERNEIWVVLDSVRSRNNVGSFFRTADAFRLGGLYLCGHTPVPPHRDIFKTALGATETVPWTYRETIGDLLASLKAKGDHHIWAVEQTHNSTPLQDFPRIALPGKWVFVFGNEVSGVSDEALEHCAGSLEIPQWGHKHSFNVSVSAGMVLWEVLRTFKFDL
ncbi:MAG TPA: TrmH family RNA methyltransferase [Edaphocola sp.]|jgi:tRNA G18 (ribose-2'-O)-methylase SpoU|nr:TrmH family RNA methyltransferase [Edaphocola sp.]